MRARLSCDASTSIGRCKSALRAAMIAGRAALGMSRAIVWPESDCDPSTKFSVSAYAGIVRMEGSRPAKFIPLNFCNCNCS